MPLLTKVFIVLNAAVWITFGPAFYFATEAFAGMLDIALQSPTALADFRGMYGGVPMAVGVFMLISLFRQEWIAAALMLILLGTSGILLGRLLTLVDTGGVSTYIYLISGLELGTILIGTWLYLSHVRTARAT